MNITDLHKMATDTVVVNAVNSLLMAKANAQVWRERVEPIQREMLKLVGATYSDKHGRKSGPIDNPKDSWLMADEQHREWCDELDHEYRSRGWLKAEDERGVCPALKAENLERLASRAVLLAASQYNEHLHPDGLLCAGLETYRRAINIVCGLVVNHSTYRKPKVFRQAS